MSEPGTIPATDPEEERALVEGLGRRDPATVNDFLERTHRSVFAMACRLTHDPGHREDWTHDVLLHLVEELGRGRFVYRWPGCFWSWFAMRARFLLLNRLRRHRLQEGRFESGPLAEQDLAAVAVPNSVSPDRVMQGLQARETVENCINKLDRDDHRRALSLLLFDELSYQEIADEMEAQLNTVRSWIRRARAAVRGCVSAAYGWENAE